mmetsp:Transcript_350/g.479  ORF Transcript_350/g.479 Transcript_350/m.479 type:complete len:426 (+) Transcript_350:207-1484(+)
MGQSDEAFKSAVLEYKYSSPTLSILERVYLNDMWASVAEIYPRWLAPNLITLGGCCCILVMYALTLVYSPELEGDMERWQYGLAAVLFYTYQTLDGTDGKQARRTGSGSALGELMDHGVDACVTTFLTLTVSDGLGYGILSFWPWMFVLVGTLSFYLSNMTLVHNGRQFFFNLDVMEVQTLMIVSLVMVAVLGTDVATTWKFPVPAFLQTFETDLGGLLAQHEKVDFTRGFLVLREVVSFAGLVGVAYNFPQYVYGSLRPYLLKAENQPEHVKKGVTGTGILNWLHHMIVIVSFVTLGCASVFFGTRLKDPLRASSAMRSFSFVYAFCFGDLMDRVLLMRVARVKLPLIPISMVPVAVFTLLAAYDEKMLALEADIPILDSAKWWRCLVAVSFVIHQSFFATSVVRLANALGIHPFKIKYNTKQD